MQVGDLVYYLGSPRVLNGKRVTADVGIVLYVGKNSVVTVLWSNGTESNHSSSWLVRMKESA